MNSTLKSECGRSVLEVFYNPETLDWNEAIKAAYALHGLRPGQARVIASSIPNGETSLNPNGRSLTGAANSTSKENTDMPVQQQIVDPFRKGVSQLRASGGFMLDGITIPSTTVPRRGIENPWYRNRLEPTNLVALLTKGAD